LTFRSITAWNANVSFGHVEIPTCRRTRAG
jgi:hypothetical protein